MTNGGTGRLLDYKVYIEGVEIPFMDININIAPNQPSSATITIIPVTTATRMRPRSHVHIFYFDDLEDVDANKGEVARWKLLWEGEVTGMGYSYSPYSRNFRIDCMDLTNMWDTTTVYMLSEFSELVSIPGLFGPTSPKQQMKYFSGSTTFRPISKFSLTGNFLPPLRQLMANMFLVVNPATNKKEPRSFEKGLRFLVDEYSKTLEYVKQHHQRKKVVDKIFAADDKQVSVLADTKLVDLFNRQYSESSRSSFRQLLAEFQSVAFYNIININTPVFDPKTNEIKSFLFKPNIYFGPPPKCNVIFPDQVVHLDFSRQFLFENTRAVITYDPLESGQQNGVFNREIFLGPSKDFAPILAAGDEVASGELQGNLRQKTNIIRLTEEELEKGVIPKDVHIGSPQYTRFGGSREALVTAADYIGEASRYEARTCSVQTEFNPGLVVDFPGLVLTKRGSFLFRLNVISHSISSTSGATTSVSGNMSRVVESDSRFIDEPVPTENINTNYLLGPLTDDGRIPVNETYKEFLGCESIVTEDILGDVTSQIDIFESEVWETLGSGEEFIEGFDELEKRRKNAPGKIIHASALNLFNSKGLKDENGNLLRTAYDTSPDKYGFAKKYTRRDGLANIEDVFEKHYNLSKNKDSLGANRPASEYGNIEDKAKEGGLGPAVFDYIPTGNKHAAVETDDDKLKNNRFMTSHGYKKEIMQAIRKEIVDSAGGVDGR